jgi:WD40 repeat protein
VHGALLAKDSAPAAGALAYSPDGRTILTLEEQRGDSGAKSAELTAVRRDAATGRPLGPGVPVRPPGWRFAAPAVPAWAVYSPDGTNVVVSVPAGSAKKPSTSGRTLVLDAQTLQLLRSYDVGSDIAALSPDGRTLALGRVPGDDRVTLLDLRTGAQRPLSGRQPGTVQGIALSPQGERVVTGGSDGSASVWDAKTGEILERLEGIRGRSSPPRSLPMGRPSSPSGLTNP